MGIPSDSAVIEAGRNRLKPLAVRMGQQVCALSSVDLDAMLVAKVKTCLFDLAGCAIESRDKAPSRQAMAMAVRIDDASRCGATVIGSPTTSSIGDAAFVNAVMGHGLVREDMHSASISHLGVVVIPTLLALAQSRRVSGRDFIAAAIAGYEVGARIGHALMDPKLARMLRPTGITGPLAGAAAGARLLGLGAARTTHALALAANTTAGLNQWGHTGGSEMYFHVGFAARNAVSAVLLAEAGAFASLSALDGEAGLFASLGKRDEASRVNLFDGPPEILAVYHKPVPACNFAQTACQAALAIARAGQCPVDRIARLEIRVPHAGATYPGCDFTGPFEHVLQAKMSIQYNVAAALITGDVTEANFGLLEDVTLHRLLRVTRLSIDASMTRAYPRLQGGAVTVCLDDGTRREAHLEDVSNATPEQVRERFRAAATSCLGADRTADLESMIDDLPGLDDAGRVAAALGTAAVRCI